MVSEKERRKIYKDLRRAGYPRSAARRLSNFGSARAPQFEPIGGGRITRNIRYRREMGAYAAMQDRRANLALRSVEGTGCPTIHLNDEPGFRSASMAQAAAARVAQRRIYRRALDEPFDPERLARPEVGRVEKGGVYYDEGEGVYYARGRRRDARGYSTALEHHSHRHSDPSHHVGSCSPACRAGGVAHGHRPTNRRRA